MTETSLYVGAGDYQIVTGGKKINLTALLTTCTGVALYDRIAGVGGLCHILLPDSPGHDYSWAPKVYATSCLNLLLADLLKAGGKISRMEAVVAGGCLPFPCSRQDINLDIGGRTRECVNRFLACNNIPIAHSKTGGCFGMALNFDTSSWQATIKPINKDRGRTEKPPAAPDFSQIKKDIAHLRPIPQVALKILRLMADEDYQLSEIAGELSLDQVLSAKVISFCNSPFIGFPAKIDSIERAVLLLGESHLLEIILTTSLKDFYNQKEGSYSLIRGGLFRHSLVVASLIKIISNYNKKINKQAAYTAGLLHDIGKVVLDQYVSENISLFYDQDEGLASSLINREKELFGTDHHEMGHELAVVWGFPENIKEAISLHHEPARAEHEPELVHAVYLADILATGFLAETNIRVPDDNWFKESINRLGLDLPDIEQIISRVPWDKLDYL